MFKQILKKERKVIATIAVTIIMLTTLATPIFAADNAWPTTTSQTTNTVNPTTVSPTTQTSSTATSGTVSPTGSSASGSLSATDAPKAAPEILPTNAGLAGNVDEAQKVYNSYVDVMPVVSTNDILKWATTKGNEIIYFLQIIVQPFTIIIFIIAAFITLIGSIGRGDMVGKGLWGMCMSVIVYASVLYAPVILQTFVGWVAS